MARPRTLTDDDILDRLSRFLSERNSVEPWTLGEAGRHIGMSPPGLVKRFGSRQGLLAALSTRWIETIPTSPRTPGNPRGELAAWVAAKAPAADTEVPLATQLSHLLTDLSDPSLTALLVEGWHRERTYVASLLAGHDLPRLTDPTCGAAQLLDALTGASLRSGAGDMEHTEPIRILENMLEAWK